MFIYKRMALRVYTFIYLILSFIEFIKYMLLDSNKFGLIYLLLTLLIIFLLVPTTHNYKKYFSKIRISKLVLIIVLGLFSSFILQGIVIKAIGVVDDSKKYIESIFVIKSILKPIMYFLLSIITLLEFKVEKLLKKH